MDENILDGNSIFNVKYILLVETNSDPGYFFKLSNYDLFLFSVNSDNKSSWFGKWGRGLLFVYFIPCFVLFCHLLLGL